MSQNLWNRQQNSIAQACGTNSKHPKAHILGVTPTHIVRAKGSKVMDENGKWYTDYICALGTNLLGYGNETVARAIQAALQDGCSHSFATHYEVRTAEKIKEMLPFTDKVKFLKTGSDACSAAVKIARAHTGRELVLSLGYHGFHKEFCDVYNGESDARIQTFTWDRLKDQPAAVIVEPVETDYSDARRDWLKALRKECTDRGIVLIFDEVITGFRWPKYSVAYDWNILPDLICLGKAIANGMPLACVGGKIELMDNPSYFVSSTYAGEVLSLAAGHQVMTMLQTSRQFSIEALWRQGEEFQAAFNKEMFGIVQIRGYPTRGILVGDDKPVALFMQEACKAGMLFGKSFFYNFRHDEVKDDTLKALEGIASRIKSGKVQLEGQMPQSPLAQKVRKS